MKKLPYIQFYPADWLSDEVAGCSLAAQGLWLRMMILGHYSDRYGYLSMNGSPYSAEAIARRCGTTLAQYETLLAELDSALIPERTPEGIIFSRRMVRDAIKRKRDIANGRKGGNPRILHPPDNPPVNPLDNLTLTLVSEIGIEFPENLKTVEFSEVWRLWEQHCREKNIRLEKTSVKMQFKRLSEMGEAQAIASITESIANNYVGVVPANGNRGKHHHHRNNHKLEALHRR